MKLYLLLSKKKQSNKYGLWMCAHGTSGLRATTALNGWCARREVGKKRFKGLASLALVTNIRFNVVAVRKSPETRCESRDFINGAWVLGAGEIVPTLQTQPQLRTRPMTRLSRRSIVQWSAVFRSRQGRLSCRKKFSRSCSRSLCWLDELLIISQIDCSNINWRGSLAFPILNNVETSASRKLTHSISDKGSFILSGSCQYRSSFLLWQY